MHYLFELIKGQKKRIQFLFLMFMYNYPWTLKRLIELYFMDDKSYKKIF